MSKNRLLRWGIIVVCIYLIITTLSSMVELWRSRDKMTRREKELAHLETERDDLLRRQIRATSSGYFEKVARDQLGLGKPGEEAIIIPEELLKAGVVEVFSDSTPNWKKWWKLLF